MSRIRTYTGVDRGRVSGPVERRKRDEVGEKLERLRKNSVRAKRETGIESGPFKVRDWER